MCQSAARGLVEGYAGLVCDLDGVVYRGARAIDSAISALTQLLPSVPVVFATNNASRTPADVARQLRSVGLDIAADRVVTSAQAGAAYLRRDLPPGAEVLAVGGDGVAHALVAAGLAPVLPRDLATSGSVPGAVLQGWGLDVTVRDLAAVCRAVASGARWVATNTDLSLPVDGGVEIPGNGTLVAAVTVATRHTPEVVGKPHRPLYEHAAAVLGSAPQESLAIGDRLETDILGAAATGMDSLWVLTGVDGFVELVTSAATPTFAAADLGALHRAAVQVCRDGQTWTGGPVRVSVGPSCRLDLEVADGAPDDTVPDAVAMVGLAVVLSLRDELARGLVSAADVKRLAWALDEAVREASGPAGQ
jgi:glycerol 3-phosphatase-2